MAFNPDGRTLLCGLHESLKVFSWEPIRCHDSVDVGWSRLSDMNVSEGKLLGCSYNQSGVGVWVVDISRIEPYTIGNNTTRIKGLPESKSNSSGNVPVLTENTGKPNLGRVSISQNSEHVLKEAKSLARLSVSQNSDPTTKEPKSFQSSGNVPGTPQRAKANPITSKVPKRNSAKTDSTANASVLSRSDVVPVIVPRNNPRLEQTTEVRKEGIGRSLSQSLPSKASDFRRFSSTRDDLDSPNASGQSESEVLKATEYRGVPERNVSSTSNKSFIVERNLKDDARSSVSSRPQKNLMADDRPLASSLPESYETRGNRSNRESSSGEAQKGGRTRSLVSTWEKKEKSPSRKISPSANLSRVDTFPPRMREFPVPAEKETCPPSEEDVIVNLMERHDEFLSSLHSRLAKLQVVQKYFLRNDVKGAIIAMEKMADPAVLADVVNSLTEKIEIVTLEICTCLLPVLSVLLESDVDRHRGIALEMVLKLVRLFGSVIYSSLSASSSSVGVDIEAEQRLERCNLCFIELEKMKCFLPALTRKGGSIAKFAHELNLALQEVS
jgi:katanin p80 WD40 repeat-containing subunit B1